MGQLQALSSRRHVELDAAYRACRRINARYGRTYFLATRLLPADRRPAVHALYGFARVADEIVDAPGIARSDRVRGLARLADELTAVLAGGPAGHPVLAALADTVRRYRIRPELFAGFLESMRMDLTVTDYATFADLGRYVYGSAGVIGLQLLPVLGTVGPPAEAEPAAAALGEAFQLTNFLRDVGEDLDRGRVYLPAAELAAFGVDRARLEWARRTGRTDPPVRRALAHLVACTRATYRRAEPGIALLCPESRPCVRTAATLYAGILDEIVAADYAVLGRRVAVPARRRAAVAASGLVRAVLARIP
ncbi:MAG TPA: phytoene/squalene synthase family protein [Actinophytocola sp.]|uniref:phytoene/squalene synthase family protein n=1 Tax=Actinophytocola sp. TaxID=1872138 RepID=UPI002DB9293B|nr:phytoene/squalene synthase family protein [Actinophytocola sp.]HEU5473998.1 phytoene/squalene synthase family protein [Actinophytocola sp.]